MAPIRMEEIGMDIANGAFEEGLRGHLASMRDVRRGGASAPTSSGAHPGDVQTLFRIEPRLLTPLSRQLQHASTAVTARAYVTNDPALQREIEQERSRRKVAMFRELFEGRKVAGKMAPAIDRAIAASRDRIMALPAERRDEEIERTFLIGAFKIHFVEDNICTVGLRPKASLCNIVSGRVDWKVDEPDYTTRDAEMCADCVNSVYQRERHGPGVLRRHIANMTIFLRAEARGDERLHQEHRRRAERDAAILDTLGISYPTKKEIRDGLEGE